MPEGKFGAPRPFADSVLSINLEFSGEPALPRGPSPGLKEEIEMQLEEELTGPKYEGDNFTLNHVTVYPAELHLPNGRMGYEVEAEFVPNGKISMAAIDIITSLIRDRVANGSGAYKTSIIAV